MQFWTATHLIIQNTAKMIAVSSKTTPTTLRTMVKTMPENIPGTCFYYAITTILLYVLHFCKYKLISVLHLA